MHHRGIPIMIETLLFWIVLGLIPVTLSGLFVTAYLQYRRGDQLNNSTADGVHLKLSPAHPARHDWNTQAHLQTSKVCAFTLLDLYTSALPIPSSPPT